MLCMFMCTYLYLYVYVYIYIYVDMYIYIDVYMYGSLRNRVMIPSEVSKWIEETIHWDHEQMDVSYRSGSTGNFSEPENGALTKEHGKLADLLMG